MKILSLMTLAALAAFSLQAQASSPAHFAAKKPKNLQQALTQIEQVTSQTAAAIAADDMDKVHKLSYSLEAALEVLNTQLKEAAHQVEVMHEASEESEAAKVKEAFDAFEPTLQLLAK